MKFFRVVIVVALVVSVVGNWLLYQRAAGSRKRISGDGWAVTRREYYDWVDKRYGVEFLAEMVRHELIMTAAREAGVVPKKQEVDEILKTQEETNPQISRSYRVQPWRRRDDRRKIEENLALVHLMIKDVKASDDEVRAHFQKTLANWNEPDKIYVKAMAAQKADAAERAKEMMRRVGDTIVIAQQLKGQAMPVGGDGSWTLRKPYDRPSSDPIINQITRMRPADPKTGFLGEVRVFRDPKTRGFVVVRLERIEKGHRADFEKVKDKVARDFKTSRAKPAKQVLRALWDGANIRTDEPGLREDIERRLFPERFVPEAAKT